MDYDFEAEYADELDALRDFDEGYFFMTIIQETQLHSQLSPTFKRIPIN